MGFWLTQVYLNDHYNYMCMIVSGVKCRLILPMMQSYASAGDFTVGGRLKSALFENAVIYGSYLLILLICIIYVAVKPNLHFSM